ncbi:MAG: hypothetical protein ACPL1A_07250 [Candidatus Kapaibacteriota bacterium]
MKKLILILFPLILITLPAFSQRKYDLIARADVLQKSLEIGLAEVGKTERTNNNDGITAKYLAPFGLPEGSPYCAAGIYWTFLQATKKLNLPESEIPIPRTALANEVFNYALKQGKRNKYLPKVNDLIVWKKAKTPFGHIERIISINTKNLVTTLAFNVRDEFSNKQGVFIKTRNIFHPLGRLAIRGLIGFREI